MISVVMPVYNGQKYLRQAIDSILNQSFTDFEFIIVDDGSSDQSVEIINSYNDNRIRLYSKQNEGVAIALNYGITRSSFDLIARMDCDDISHSQRFEKQYSFLNCNSDVQMVGTGAYVIDEEGEFVYEDKVITDYQKIKSRLPASSFYHPSVMFRKSAFEKCGGYPVYMKRAQDAVLFTRIANLGKITNLPEALIDYRITSGSLSVRSKKDRIFISELVNQALNNENGVNSEKLLELESRIKKHNPKEREFHYHLFLIKKYSWDNANRRKVFNHLRSAYKLKWINIELFYLTILSFMPNNVVKYLYSRMKL